MAHKSAIKVSITLNDTKVRVLAHSTEEIVDFDAKIQLTLLKTFSNQLTFFALSLFYSLMIAIVMLLFFQ